MLRKPMQRWWIRAMLWWGMLVLLVFANGLVYNLYFHARYLAGTLSLGPTPLSLITGNLGLVMYPGVLLVWMLVAGQLATRTP